MKYQVLKRIRERVLKAIREMPVGISSRQSIGRGAAGDKTYPVDKIAEDIIISEFKSSSEPYSIISEEYGMMDIRGGGKKVLIDPIDGSKNAVVGIPFFCTSIAIANGNNIGAVEVAYVLNLINGDEFFAEKGKGAFFNERQIRVQQEDEFNIVAYEAQSPALDIPRILPLLSRSSKTRCLGATALDLAYLAYGAISVFVSPSPSRSFDFAGGYLLVKEAGGVLTDIRGNTIEGIELDLKKRTTLLVSANVRLHEKALQLLEMNKFA